MTRMKALENNNYNFAGYVLPHSVRYETSFSIELDCPHTWHYTYDLFAKIISKLATYVILGHTVEQRRLTT